MFTVIFTGFFLYCLRNTAAVGAELLLPKNVTVVTLNTNYMLKWDWEQSAAENPAVTFTTQYVAKYRLFSKKKNLNWPMACENESLRSCDLTELHLYYLGIYMLRVRANVNGCHSVWVEKEFCPDKDAAVGPPSKVDLSPAGSLLDVDISHPLTSTNSSMKEVLRELYYTIVYWEGSAHTQASDVQMLSSSATLVTLPNLKAWTWYCVSVQSRADFYNKSSGFTSPHCIQTEGGTPWWLIFSYFLGSLVICFTVVLLLIYGVFKTFKTAVATFFPSYQLPSHLKEYLFDSPGSLIPGLITPDSESELLFDKVVICSEAVLEVHCPPPEALHQTVRPSGLEQDSSGRHIRQDSSSSSSSSGDSGVYSTRGVSSQRQPSDHSSAGSELSWQSQSDPEQVRMQDMVPGVKNPLVIIDEGVVDMSV